MAGSVSSGLLSVVGRAEHEGAPVKGSRFIGVIQPTRTLEEATALAEELWSLHPKARHVCWAFRGRGRDELRWADDGEPTGTAGRPILNVIDGAQLSWVTVAVVRYFGGTKLGTGGLSRAYSEATKGVIEQATTLQLTPRVDLSLSISYAHEGSAQHLLERHEATLREARYDTQVHLAVTLAAERVEEVVSDLIELSAGRVQLTRSEVYLGA